MDLQLCASMSELWKACSHTLNAFLTQMPGNVILKKIMWLKEGGETLNETNTKLFKEQKGYMSVVFSVWSSLGSEMKICLLYKVKCFTLFFIVATIWFDDSCTHSWHSLNLLDHLEWFSALTVLKYFPYWLAAYILFTSGGPAHPDHRQVGLLWRPGDLSLAVLTKPVGLFFHCSIEKPLVVALSP